MRVYNGDDTTTVSRGTGSTMQSILIIEDDPIILQTMAYSLRRAGYEVAGTGVGTEALGLAKRLKPDLVLLDLMLPGMDGYEIAEQLRVVDEQVAIIMVSALAAERDKVRGLDVGADDYIAKPFSTEELLARVRANLRRVGERESPTAEQIEAGDLVLDPLSHKVSVAGDPVSLRLKEFQLLLTLARHQGALCTRQMLAEEVWGHDHMTSSRTIDTHIRRIRQAVEEPSAFQYIHTVHGLGYRFEVARRALGKQ